MRPFYENSSAAKMITPELSYRYALKHMSNPVRSMYALRQYQSDGSYIVLDVFTTRKAAEVAKSFADIRLGKPTAIVGITRGWG